MENPFLTMYTTKKTKLSFVTLLFGVWLRTIGVFSRRGRSMLGFMEPHPGAGEIHQNNGQSRSLSHTNILWTFQEKCWEVLRWCFPCNSLWVPFILFCTFRAEMLRGDEGRCARPGYLLSGQGREDKQSTYSPAIHLGWWNSACGRQTLGVISSKW